MRPVMSRLAAAFAVIVLAACASGGASTETPSTPSGGGAATSTSLPISVVNEHGSAQHFVLYIEPSAGGIRQSLGEVPVGVTKSFTFNGPHGQYVLVAQTPGGNSTSPRFTHNGTNKVSWDRSTNRVISSNK